MSASGQTTDTLAGKPMSGAGVAVTPPNAPVSSLSTQANVLVQLSGGKADVKLAVAPKQTYENFLAEMLGPDVRKKVYEEIERKASGTTFGTLAADVKTFNEDPTRDGARFAIGHFVDESLTFYSLATEAAKTTKKIAAHFGGRMLEPIKVLTKLFPVSADEKDFIFNADAILHIRTEEILATDGSPKNGAQYATQKFASISGKHGVGTPADLKDAVVYVFECYGSKKAGEQKVKNSIPPTGKLFASMMQYYLNHDVSKAQVFLGNHHDSRQTIEKAKESSKAALDKFIADHAQWKLGASIPASLLGSGNEQKGNRVSFTSDAEVCASEHFKAVLGRFMATINEDPSKKKLFIDAIVAETATHLLELFAKENNVKDIKALKNLYQSQKTKESSKLPVAPDLKAAQPKSDSVAVHSDSSGSSTPTGSSDSDDDDVVIDQAEVLERRAEKYAKRKGKPPTLLTLQALLVVGNFNRKGRGSSPESKKKLSPIENKTLGDPAVVTRGITH